MTQKMTVAALQIALKKVCAQRSADNAPIVNTRHAMRQRKIGFDALELGFSEPKIFGSPASLKRKIEPKGEITMRKPSQSTT